MATNTHPCGHDCTHTDRASRSEKESTGGEGDVEEEAEGTLRQVVAGGSTTLERRLSAAWIDLPFVLLSSSFSFLPLSTVPSPTKVIYPSCTLVYPQKKNLYISQITYNNE